MKSLVFAKRIIKELIRDPLSSIFCIGFPLVMLLIMSLVNASIPAEANMTIFQIKSLAPGIAYFGLSFIMLFTGLQVSKDRSSALLLRLYASPMKPIQYLLGYTLPVLLLGLAQMILCFIAAMILAAVTGTSLSITGSLLSILLLIPSLFMFIALGLLLGSAFGEKTVPGICSILLSAVGMIGGIWMDVDQLGGGIKAVSSLLPFYHGVKLARLPFVDTCVEIAPHLLWTLLSVMIIYPLAAWVFTSKMKKDIR